MTQQKLYEYDNKNIREVEDPIREKCRTMAALEICRCVEKNLAKSVV